MAKDYGKVIKKSPIQTYEQIKKDQMKKNFGEVGDKELPAKTQRRIARENKASSGGREHHSSGMF